MAQGKRSPPASVRASANRRKKSSRTNRKRKRAQPFAARTRCWLYDGTQLLATLITKHTGETRAFGADRQSLGSFPTFKDATKAVNKGAG
jgi:hypothetical protein